MESKLILVIDDEEPIQKVVGLSLKMEANWQIVCASSGIEGLNLAAEYQPDAILLDVMMPDVDGISTFERLRNNLQTKNIPVILLTAKTGTAEKRLFQRIGVTGVITKPFDSLSLASQIARLAGWQF